MRDAQHTLEERRREDALKLNALRIHIKAGLDDLDQGNFIEVDDADLNRFLEELIEKPRRRKSRRRG